jgi:NADP-dependent 3-hydroxy acid dehydrogenase YdfG
MSNAPVILVTGASSGIGEATARLFAQQGYRVVLAARRLERLQSLADEICSRRGEALVVQTDLADISSIQRMVKQAQQTWGQIDVLFNNAGLGRLDWLDRLDAVEDIQLQLQVNLLGLVCTTQAVLPGMIERRQGHIINMGSIASFVATPTYSVYAATKFGIRGFTDSLRREVRIYGIRVSGIYPGGTLTEFNEHAKINRKTGYTTPKSIKLTSVEVAEAVWRLVQKPRRVAILPGVMRFTIWMNRFFPGVVDYFIEKRFTIPERLGPNE